MTGTPNYPQIVGVAQPGTAHLLVVNADGSLNTNPATPPDYEAVAAGETDEPLGTGAIGDRLISLVCTVATAATSAVSIKDGGGSAIPVLAANTPIGAYTVVINAASAVGGWSVTTAAGVTVVATGIFTA